MNNSYNTLAAKLVGLHSRQPIVYMREDCHICQSESYRSLVRLKLSHLTNQLTAELHIVDNEFHWNVSIADYKESVKLI